MKVLNKNVDNIKEEIRFRFYPRKLIMMTDENVFKYLVKQALMFLNKYGYYSRFVQGKVVDNCIDLDSLVYPTGINGANCVIRLYPLYEFNNVFNSYNMLLGNVPFHYAITNNNDIFLEFLYATKLIDDLRYKFRNINDFIVINNKIMLNSRYFSKLGNEFVIEYIARFDLDSVSWSFFDVEYTFVIELLEALVMYREGLAQSELSFAGDLSGNYQLYLDKGDERINKIIENFVSGAVKSTVIRVR